MPGYYFKYPGFFFITHLNNNVMEPFPFHSDKFNESLIEMYRDFYAWLWRKISTPFSKKGKTPDRISSQTKEHVEAKERVAIEQHYDELV